MVDVMDAFKRYEKTRDPDLRNEILMSYIHIVKNIVRKMIPSYRKYIDTDDLMSYGVIGLMDAIEKFDYTKGIKFETYAYLRVKGEIIDQIRKLDFAPTNLRQRLKKIEEAFSILETENQKPPSEEDVAVYLGVSVEAVRKTLDDSYTYNVIALDEVLVDNYTDTENRNAFGQPEQSYDKKETIASLVDAIESLPERERLVVTLYYYEEMNLKEIGAVLGVSESRVSQIHSKALMKMRTMLE